MPDSRDEALRILYVRSRPLVGVDQLDDRLEFDKLVQLLDSAKLPIRLHLLPHATARAFHLELGKGYDIIYFDGHGKEDSLAFEGPCGELHQLPVADFTEALRGSNARLAVLSACESAGQLAALVQAGVSAAVGMTERVSQQTTAAYAESFFAELARGRTLGEAHSRGRLAVRLGLEVEPKEEEIPALLPNDSDLTLAAPGQTGKLELVAVCRHTNITLPDKPFIGRGEMTVEINRVLEKNRVVVLEGEGGIGKTALAQNVAVWQAERNKCPGGAAFVSFDPPLSRDLAIDAIGVALLGQDFSKAKGNHVGILKQHFTKRPGLVVLDNFESVSKDSGVLQLINDLSQVARVLITTREQIGMGRTVIVKELDDDFAAMLFLKLARDAGWDGTGDRDTLKAICSELGNMPLAIELVAPQAATLALATILDRVGTDLASVAADNPTLPKRQRSIMVSLNLSHEPLAAPARVLFRRLSVFAAGALGFMFPQVCEVRDWENPIAELVHHRLVRFEDGRYSMLPPVRRYAVGKLAEAGEKDKYEGQLATYFGTVAQQIREQMNTKNGAKWIEASVTELGDLLAAQRWFLDNKKWDEVGMLTSALDDPLDRAGLWAARTYTIGLAVEAAKGKGDKKNEAGMLHNLAVAFSQHGDYAEARPLTEQSLAIATELGDKAGIAKTLHQLANLAEYEGDYIESRELCNRSLALFRGLGHRDGISTTLALLALLEEHAGNYAGAGEFYHQSLALKQELGDKAGIALNLHQLANVALHQGDNSEARKLYHESLALRQELGDKSGIAHTLGQLASIEMDQGRLDSAKEGYEKVKLMFEALGDKYNVACALHQLAILAQVQCDYGESRQLCRRALAIEQQIGAKPCIAKTLHQLGMLAQLQGHCSEAHNLYDQSLAIKQEIGDKAGMAITLGQLGRLAEAEEDDRSALRNYLQALAIFEGLKSPYRNITKQDIARMQQRLGDEALKKLHDEVVAELSEEQSDSQSQPTADS